MSHTDAQVALMARLHSFFHEMNEVKLPDAQNAQDADSFVFHMMEVLHDLRRCVDIVEHPDRYTRSEFQQAISSLLYHDLPHLIAAARKYDYVPDIL